MADAMQVAEGAEASRRAAWAKFFDARDALASVAAQELWVAVFGDSARFAWHAGHILTEIDQRVNLESMAAQIGEHILSVSDSDTGLTVPGVVDHSEASARALIAAWRRGHNVHGTVPRYAFHMDDREHWSPDVDRIT